MNCNIIPVATGDKWIGYGIRASSSVIRELIQDTKKEVVLTAYLLTNREIVSYLHTALNRGISVIIYIYAGNNPFKESGAAKALYELKNKYPYLRIVEVNKIMLHAKVIISDGERMYCGSANLSDQGMDTNYELGFLINDSVTSCKIRDLIQKLDES